MLKYVVVSMEKLSLKVLTVQNICQNAGVTAGTTYFYWNVVLACSGTTTPLVARYVTEHKK